MGSGNPIPLDLDKPRCACPVQGGDREAGVKRDSTLRYHARRLAASDAEQVAKLRDIIKGLGLELATLPLRERSSR